MAVELRPPRSDLEPEEGMGAWIDLHHSLGRLTSDDLFVFLTDNAVGGAEEENLAHVGANVGEDVDLRRIIPILTTKHSVDYCMMFASRAQSEGFDALTVLGGDKSVGVPRCVPHGRDLRELLRERLPDLVLGGWANPHRDAEEQVAFLTADDATADFALTQVVSHHSLPGVERFLERMHEVGATVPTVFGVFFYRSANPSTLEALGGFFPVPAEAVTHEFERASRRGDLRADDSSPAKRRSTKDIHQQPRQPRRRPSPEEDHGPGLAPRSDPSTGCPHPQDD